MAVVTSRAGSVDASVAGLPIDLVEANGTATRGVLVG
jgi:hypothetical protein